MGVIVRGTVTQGESFMCNCLRSKIPGGNFSGGISLGVIVRGNLSRRKLFRGNCLGAKVRGVIVLGGIS